MAEIEKKPAYVKLTVETPLCIDFEYWKSKEQNWRSLLAGYLCEEHYALFHDSGDDSEIVDVVDPETGEVEQKDVLLDCLFSHCARQNGFVPENGPLTDSIFRVFLSHGNQPLSASELGDILNKNPNTILKTLTSRTYRGIRPLS
ncbi:MAG: hypothetical protein IKP86_09320 [Anaerolineaceae bacterium]|nr:hypothetical protein [Anaerolineaceae bacterium]